MKNIVRAFAIVLTLAGSVAYTQIQSSNASKVTVARVNCLPIPACPPNDPNACGMGVKK